MVNIAFIIGTGYYGEDILHKLPWVSQLDKHNIFVASRIRTDVHLSHLSKNILGNTRKATIDGINQTISLSEKYCFLYDSDYINQYYKLKQMKDVQKWLGISIDYISSFDRKFYDRKKMKDQRDKEELNQYITGMILFFRNFFINNRIEIFINTIEDTIFSVVAYYVAEKLGIEIVGYMTSRFPKKGVMFCKNFNKILEWNQNYNENQWSEIKGLYTNETVAGEDNLEKNRSYWSLSSLSKKIMDLNLLREYKLLREDIIHNFNNERFILEPSLYRFKMNLKGAFRLLFVNKFFHNPNFNEQYYLFPLHYMEDAQVTFREPLFKQYEIIAKISRTLPLGSILYVKPHPHYFGTDVSIRELIKISKIKNVKIIYPSYPPMELIKKSIGLITLNSTTGFESLILEVPVLTMGHDFYCKNDLCFMLRDNNDLSKLLMQLQKLKSNKTIKNFVKKVYSNTIWVKTKDYDYAYGLTESDGYNIASALDVILELYEGI